jgi:hypothetical protein
MTLDLACVQGERLPEALVERVRSICEAENIPPEGITILGGKPYINVTGLDNKVKQRCERECLEFTGVSLEDVTPEDAGSRKVFRATVTLFNAALFARGVADLGGTATPEAVAALRDAYTYRFTDIGSASPESVQMRTMKNPDNIAMMASRRATNRAKRAAVGVGLTSLEEVSGTLPGGGGHPPVNVPRAPAQERPDPDAPPVYQVVVPHGNIITKGQIGEYTRTLERAYPDKAERAKAHNWVKARLSGKGRDKWTESEWEWAMDKMARKAEVNNG